MHIYNFCIIINIIINDITEYTHRLTVYVISVTSMVIGLFGCSKEKV